jgi:molybdopterin-guanine dinucleotide biosynthesis protein A
METTAGRTPRFPGRSAAILAGGKSSRMGTNKALLDVRGGAMIRRTAGLLRPLVDDLFLVADDPVPYADLDLPVVPDIHPGRGPLGGIHAAIVRAAHPLVLCVACDMPHILPGILDLLLDAADPGVDAVVPRPGGRPEALLAVSGRSALTAIERSVAAGRLKVMRALEGLRVRFLDESELARVDPGRCSFSNVNTPADLAAARAFAGRGRP